MSKYKYFRPDHGGSIERAHEFDSDWGPDHGDWIAEDAAQDHYHEHDGWESSWPVKFSIVFDDGRIETYEIELDHEPSFSASLV
jgi:hypothetical protein